jgi:hypothetical protein
MTTTTEPLTIAQRREQLESLAFQWDQMQQRLRDLAHPSLEGEALAAAWHQYREALAVADDIGSGVRHWTDWNEAMTCPDRQGRAYEEAAEWAAGARDVLINGEN